MSVLQAVRGAFTWWFTPKVLGHVHMLCYMDVCASCSHALV